MTHKPKFPEERTPKEYLGLSLRGFCMGCADVVPGVSGGTMAFILGIYEELIESIRMLGSKEMFQALSRFDVRRVFEVFRWRFLGAILLGIGVAFLSLSKVISWLLETQPVYIWSFFYGLVLASIYSVSRRKSRWTALSASMLVFGAVGAYYVVGMVPLQTPEAAWFLFLSGFLAICAMILPGISGSFILVLLGKYEFVLNAVNERNIMPLFYVALGCTIGIITFCQFLSWLFRHYHDLTIAVLIGFMIGSLRKIWPWKETVSTILDRHGHPKPVEQINILPDSFSGEVLGAIALAAVGFILVLALDRLANRKGGMQV